MNRIHIGIVGTGNCASSLVQGVAYYADPANGTGGLANPVCAGYSVSDIQFTSAFDVNTAKIGRDLSEAIWIPPNNALKFADVPPLSVPVYEGVLGDSIGKSTAHRLESRGRSRVQDIADHLKRTETHVVVNFLPAGSQTASEMYADAAIRAGCAFVNCIPSVIARSPEWVGQFEAAGLPLLGDDLTSQLGSTLVHHALVDLLARNGLHLSNTYQIVTGGNMDFLNLQDSDRVQSKKETKVQGFGGAGLPADSVHFGAEFVPFLKDRKVAFIRIDGSAFGGTPLELELRMSVEDSPGAAGNVFDAVRYMKFAMEQGMVGVIHPVASLLMKAPPQRMSEPAAREILSAWKK